MHRNKSVDVHRFAMVPRADIPRSSFVMETAHKTTFDAGYLVPVYLEEILPGDTFNLHMTALCRMATPIFPVMDNLYLDTFFFFVPNRLVWANWKKFMGEQTNPGDSISFSIPQVTATPGGYATGSLFDYFGLPIDTAYTGGGAWTHNALPMRCYNLIWHEWFRDENLQLGTPAATGDGPDLASAYLLRRRGKRHDYFTSCLPFLQKGTAVTLPLGTSAPVKTSGATQVSGAQTSLFWTATDGAALTGTPNVHGIGTSSQSYQSVTAGGSSTKNIYPNNLYADLSTATAATINQLRQSFQIQRLLERDARGGTRYTEIVRSHFGVISPDARLQRPEYLGGSSTPINISPVAQTSTDLGSSDAPVGQLAAFAQGVSRSGFTASFTEHGYVIGLVSVRADLSYQQGLNRLWSRSTRYDFYFPAFAALGEQAVLNQEIFWANAPGTAANQDQGVFGYQERWAEYRYHPSLITGQFRSTYTTPLDAWHLSQEFASLPVLDNTFIQETPPIQRVSALGSVTDGNQFLFDSFFSIRAARPMPLYSVPGLIDHF